MIFQPTSFAEWIALFALVAPLTVASASGLWAVWVRAQENKRKKWERVEHLLSIVYNGASHGLWAQKLAVAELRSLQKSTVEIADILPEAATFFEGTGENGRSLASYIRAKA